MPIGKRKPEARHFPEAIECHKRAECHRHCKTNGRCYWYPCRVCKVTHTLGRNQEGKLVWGPDGPSLATS